MTATFVWPDHDDQPVIAVTDEVQYALHTYTGALIATWPGRPQNGGGVTMTEHGFTQPFCRPVGEAWTFVGECTRDGHPCWHWRRLWALAKGGA